MTKKWTLISVVYIAGLVLMLFSIMKLHGLPQVAGMAAAIVCFVLYMRMRARYKNELKS